MPRLLLVSAFALVCSYATPAAASDDCLEQGDSIGVFYVTKVAGAEDDGVEPGEDLCYRCRYGSSPMIMVFARNTNGKVPELLKQMESAVSENEESSLRGLLTLMGEDVSKLKADAEKIATMTAVKKVPVVVAKEAMTGPLNYKLAADAAVTIVVAKDSQVVNTHTFASDKIDIAEVMQEVKLMLD